MAVLAQGFTVAIEYETLNFSFPQTDIEMFKSPAKNAREAMGENKLLNRHK